MAVRCTTFCLPFHLGTVPGQMRFVGIFMILTGILASCQLIPSKPDAVFVLYRDRMRSENLTEARQLLDSESRKLVTSLESEYKLDQPPEALALLNALDPTATPVVMQTEDNLSLVQIRTLKGGQRTVRIVRKDSGSPWSLDISAELKSLKAFLDARNALEMMRDQAGEYAAGWRAFNEQMKRMPPSEPESAPAPPPKQHLQKPPAKKPTPKKENTKKPKRD